MAYYIEVEYNKLNEMLQENGLSDKYFLKIKKEAIEIYNSKNEFVYGSNDIEDLKDNIEFLKIKEEKINNKRMSN